MEFPKPERSNERLNVHLTPRLKQQLREYANESNVSDASAVRHILALFFDSGNFGETKECNRRYIETEKVS